MKDYKIKCVDMYTNTYEHKCINETKTLSIVCLRALGTYWFAMQNCEIKVTCQSMMFLKQFLVQSTNTPLHMADFGHVLRLLTRGKLCKTADGLDLAISAEENLGGCQREALGLETGSGC